MFKKEHYYFIVHISPFKNQLIFIFCLSLILGSCADSQDSTQELQSNNETSITEDAQAEDKNKSEEKSEDDTKGNESGGEETTGEGIIGVPKSQKLNDGELGEEGGQNGKDDVDPKKGNNDEIDSPIKKERNLVPVGYIIFFINLILLLTVTTLLLKEIKWRKRHTKSESIVFPNAHLDFLEKLTHSYKRLYGEVIDFGNASVGSQKNTESLISEMIESMGNLNLTIDKQNKEIKQLKEGYDFTIKKNSIIPLIELNELVKEFLNDNTISEETIEKLNKVKGYISSDLENMDVFEFEVESGKSTRELVPDEWELDKLEITQDDNLNDIVVRTTKNGYENIHPNGRNILVKAKVLVYKKEKENG
tara:strand:+ start:236 stop:1324 length:1089 start_codon:yes stop_codon:yes gene_type:complete